MKQMDLSSNTLISTHHIQIRWVDMDAYCHVNNTRYFDYMMEARMAIFAEAFSEKGVQYMLVHTSCDFKKPMAYPQKIILKQYFYAIARTSFTLHYSFHDVNDEEILYATGEGILVAVDLHTQKATAVPDAIKKILQISH